MLILPTLQSYQLRRILDGLPLGHGTPPPSMKSGVYYSLSQVAAIPVPSDSSWVYLATGVPLQDVGVNDHTTYVQDTTSPVSYIHAMIVLPALSTLQSYTFSHFSGDVLGSQSYHAVLDAGPWTAWDNPYPVPPAAGPQAWRDVARDPADAAGKQFFGLTVKDGGFDFVWDNRLGDLRLTYV